MTASLTQADVDAWVRERIAARAEKARIESLRAETARRERAQRTTRAQPRVRSYLWGAIQIVEWR